MREKIQPPESSKLIQTFLKRVKTIPDKIALKYHDQYVTYDELNKNSNKLAHEIKNKYPELFQNREEPLTIGVMNTSKLNTVYCMLAILKLGAAFVPFNPGDPAVRREFVIAKSKISLLLTDAPKFSSTENTAYFCINDFATRLSDTSEVEIGVANDDLAYILFTSGSTAKNPKGVMQTHKGLNGQIENYTKDLKITNADNLLNLANFTHDQAMVDCFGALLNGATLCLYDLNNLSVEHLHTFMKTNRVSIFSALPSMFNIIFEEITNDNLFPDLRIVTIGGEETKRAHAVLFQKTCPDHCLLINGYGATEISWVSYYIITKNTDLHQLDKIPLGIMTERVDVLLEEEEGLKELCIGSDYLSPGYFDDDDATKAAYFNVEGKRYYRTGDIVRLDNDQCYHFEGRKIWHEKISGKRVNLHEIEHILIKSHLFNDCVLIAHGEGEKRKLYALYETPFPYLNEKIKEVQEGLRKELDEYMIPKFIWLEQIPKLPNGKVNRQALIQELETKSAQQAVSVKSQPKDLNEILRTLWSDAIDLPTDFSASTNFIELGGSSQIAIRLANQINCFFKNNYQTDALVSPVDFYNYSNFSHFSTYFNKEFKGYKTQKLVGCFEPPKLEVVQIQQKLDWSTFKTNLTSELFNFDYSGLEILVDHYNRLHGIKMLVAPTHEQLLEQIASELAKPDCPYQLGILAQRYDHKNGHIIPAVLCRNENEVMTLLVAESTEGFQNINGLYDKEEFYTKLHNIYPEMKLGSDCIGRQNDLVSCWSESLMYLIECLQLDMMQKIILYDDDIVGGYDFAFLSPPDAYKTSTVTLPNEFPPNILLNSISNKTLEQFIEENSELCLYTGNYSAKCNTYLWRHSFEFKKVIERYLEEHIYPSAYHFQLIYEDKKGPAHQDLHMKSAFFDRLLSVNEFISFIGLFLEQPVDCMSHLVIDGEKLTDLASISGKTMDQCSSIDVHVVYEPLKMSMLASTGAELLAPMAKEVPPFHIKASCNYDSIFLAFESKQLAESFIAFYAPIPVVQFDKIVKPTLIEIRSDQFLVRSNSNFYNTLFYGCPSLNLTLQSRHLPLNPDFRISITKDKESKSVFIIFATQAALDDFNLYEGAKAFCKKYLESGKYEIKSEDYVSFLKNQRYHKLVKNFSLPDLESMAVRDENSVLSRNDLFSFFRAEPDKLDNHTEEMPSKKI